MIAVGFLDYVASRADKPLLFGEDSRIEWKLAQDGRKIGTAIAKRIDKVIDKLGLREAAAKQGREITSMHSLRHSWEDLARAANIQMDVRRQLAGRQMEDDAVQAGYGSGAALSRRRVAIAKIDPFGDKSNSIGDGTRFN